MYYGSPESYEWYGKRCLLYVRVSTEEQARKGYSLEAQLEELEAFAKQYCMKVVGIFTDDGVTARKEVHRRKGLSALLESVKQGATDYVLFIKLDRWFRSVREYYKVQDILDAHEVNWKAILEDYDTTTTNGRLNLNIRLSVAQDESDRTSDRIKFINENRVKHGGAITGSCPMGLYSHNGKVIVDEEKAVIARAIFECYAQSGSIGRCVDKALALTGRHVAYNTITLMLENKLYIGEYRGNTEYCEAIVDRQLFDSVQRIRSARTHTREKKRDYVFSGLIRCPECGRKMSGVHTVDRRCGREYYRYRCGHKYQNKVCGNSFTPWEKRIEDYLLSNVRELMYDYITEIESTVKKATSVKTNYDSIRRRISRLQTLYLDELIDLDAYRAEYDKLSGMLSDIQAPKIIAIPPTFDRINSLLDTNLESLYGALSRKEKNLFWGSFIKHIDVYNINRFDIAFL